MRRFFQHDLAKLEHPYVMYDRRGRPGAKLERKMVEASVRPLVDAVQRILRRGVRGILTETEYLFFNYCLKMDEGVIKEHYLDLTLCHDGPDRGDCGPIAQISLSPAGVTRWIRDYKNELVYQSIATNHEDFHVAMVNSIRFIFGDYREII
ncbi:MAG: hypothetical protein Q7S32_04140 [bacterium]|nr:hypothetical protein [bacterium]